MHVSFKIHFDLLILCACIRVWVCVHGTCVEVKEQLAEVSSPLAPRGLQESNSSLQF